MYTYENHARIEKVWDGCAATEKSAMRESAVSAEISATGIAWSYEHFLIYSAIKFSQERRFSWPHYITWRFFNGIWKTRREFARGASRIKTLQMLWDGKLRKQKPRLYYGGWDSHGISRYYSAPIKFFLHVPVEKGNRLYFDDEMELRDCRISCELNDLQRCKLRGTICAFGPWIQIAWKELNVRL